MNILYKGKTFNSFQDLWIAVNQVTVSIPNEGVYTFECKEDAIQFVSELGYSPAQ
jgi:hypothetical protein